MENEKFSVVKMNVLLFYLPKLFHLFVNLLQFGRQRLPNKAPYRKVNCLTALRLV